MAAAQRAKASDKQAVCKKLVTTLKKKYKSSVPKNNRSVLDTILFGICLENATHEQAEQALKRLESEFHDLNEIRVSSITEIQTVFQKLDNGQKMDDPDWRALRVRSLLHFIFEKYFAFDFEPLRRKTLDQATKQLAKIPHISPFVRDYTLQNVLGSHVVPIDDYQARTAVWLGLAEPGTEPEKISEELKSALRKADGPLFCYLLRQLATDPEFKDILHPKSKKAIPEEGFELEQAPDRLKDLIDGKIGQTTKQKSSGKTAKTKTASQKSTSKKSNPKKSTAKKSNAKKSKTKSAAKTKTSAKSSKKNTSTKKTDNKRKTGKKTKTKSKTKKKKGTASAK